MDADKQEEIIAFVLRSIILAKLYTDLRSTYLHIIFTQQELRLDACRKF